jgi:HK97 family phage prohead protease
MSLPLGIFTAPLELKFAGDGTAGEFEGYGAIFGNTDWHGDQVVPGAFTASLAEHKARGTMPAMFIEHGPALGGDRLPAGIWTVMEEDAKGLRVKGKISALDTDYGRRVRSLMQDGALKGLSMGYRVSTNGAVYGKKAGEPRRQLKAVHLTEVSIVRDPSNANAQVDGIKAALDTVDATKAAQSIAAAMRLHDRSMGESYSYGSPKDKALLMDHLRDAHLALTGMRAPDGIDGWTKSMPEPAAIKAALIAGGMSPEDAETFTTLGLKAAPLAPRDLTDTGLSDLGNVLAGFSLPSFGS